jgi:hypothetical protein
VSAIYGHPRGIALAESKGYTVTMLTHAQAMRMLVAP